jgi:hypothetical protein
MKSYKHLIESADPLWQKMLPLDRELLLIKEQIEAIEESADAALKKKSDASGIALSTLKTVYKRGFAAWNSGHRPGTTPHQWGMARVNSYITKGKTYHTTDKDLHENVDYMDEGREKYHAGLSKSTAAAREKHWKDRENLSDSDPKAYEPAPGDKTAETKPSKYTKKYHEIYGEEVEEDYDTPSTEYLELTEAEYQGKKVELNKPFRTPDGPRKFAVHVKNSSGKIVIVRFGDPNMEIKRDDPERRKSFRARHQCDTAKDNTTPRYWSCRMWSTPSVTDILKD